MIDVKASLKIAVPGTVFYSEEECLKTTQKMYKGKDGKRHTKEVVSYDYSKLDHHSMLVTMKHAKGKTTKDKISFFTRKTKEIPQNMNFTTDQYKYMVDKECCPAWEKQFVWKKMSEEERFKSHCKAIAETLRARVVDTYIF